MSFNNWLEWSYDNKPFSTPSSPDSIFSLKINPTTNLKVGSYHEELLNNAIRIRENIQGPIDLFFSGGINSQSIMRSFLELKIPFNIYIIKFNDDINLDDVASAVNICQNFNLNYQVLNFNLKEFFETEAETIYQKCFSIDPKKLILLKAIEYTDGTPIFGDNEFYFIPDGDMWKLKLTEENFKITTASDNFSKKIIADWFYYSPELILSFVNHPLVIQLLKNEMLYKKSSLSIRGLIYKEYWNDFTDRKKMAGFENFKKYLIPDYILEFYKTKKNNINKKPIYYFTKDDLETIFKGINSR
jgi:hypothetical protein